ncbi:MAG: D-alanyl-D-alanine carboxypeptidase/D-alanyl-D-alanine-endopeptidase [Prevotellaceae bacterium]|jgi:D-alanyl-D-alanine carboxypeptidase/D-alanyl-D-alanine-endopeptidase (penicillin-binding protein 4)|nr:D-alanyl-D-alanine carboxypeptidase/D-alanyl-D-alanine-endopeptidase [Prevotellaceae bacterium]
MKIQLIILFSVFALLAKAQTPIERFVNAPNMKHAQISFQIRELETNKIIAEYQSQKSLTPASVVKIITTATALDILGADFRFETQLEHSGKIENGTLNNNLYIRGGGDPTLGSEFFNNTDFISEWINAVKKAGIKTIYGEIIADASIFDREPIPVRWTWEDMGNYYAAGVYGLSAFDNTCRIYFNSQAAGTTPQIIKTVPPVDYRFDNRLKAAANSKDSAYIYGVPYSNERVILGTIPANKKDFSIKGDIAKPPEFLADFFKEKLIKNGISLKNPRQKFVTKRELIYTHYSPYLSEIVKITNFKSNNLFAEHIFKYLSLQKAKVGNNKDAVSVVLKHWQEKGLDTSGVFLYDGSGLAPQNAVSADFLTQLLVIAKKNEAFYSSLPLAGREGTVANFLKGTALEGNARLKSGSIDGVQAYAGYIKSGGKEYAVTILVNRCTGSRAEVRRQMAELLKEYK